MEKGCWGNGGESVKVVGLVEEEGEGRKDGSTRNLFTSVQDDRSSSIQVSAAHRQGEG